MSLNTSLIHVFLGKVWFITIEIASFEYISNKICSTLVYHNEINNRFSATRLDYR